MISTEDYYEILGVDYFARDAELRNAYLAKIKFYHPDRFAGSKNFAEDMTAKINIAYSTLKDYDKRKRYDFDNGIVEKRNKILEQKRREAEYKKKQQQKQAKQKEKEIRKAEKKKEKIKQKEAHQKTKTEKQKGIKAGQETNVHNNDKTINFEKDDTKTQKNANRYDKINKIFAKSEKRKNKEEKKQKKLNKKNDNDKSSKKLELTDQERKEKKSVLIERLVLDGIIIGLVLTIILVLIFH